MSALNSLDQLLQFLQHAPALFASAGNPLLLRLHLPLPHHNEPIACVAADGRFLISGTDILRVLLFRFRCLARPVTSMKKFEEGVFSDLRNLKPGDGARLEPARSSLLDSLYRFGCVRTQKRQKVFYWEAVDHDRLFRDAWERESRREREAVEKFQRENPGASLADPGAPLAQLDDATVETAAVWHQTRPLLLTIVRSVEDPIERPLNAGAVSAAMGTSLDKTTSAMLGLQRFRSASSGSGKEEDRCGGLIVRRRAAVARSRASSGESSKSGSGALLPPPPLGQVRDETEWWVAAGLADPSMLGRTLPALPMQPPMPTSDPFMHHGAMDPLVMYPELFADAFAVPTPDPTANVRTSPDPPLLRGLVNRSALMAELEAFLTPPQQFHEAALPDLASSLESMAPRERRASQSSPTLQIDDDKEEDFPDVPSSRSDSPIRSSTPWPVPSRTSIANLTAAAERVLGHLKSPVHESGINILTPPSDSLACQLGKRERRPSGTLSMDQEEAKRLRVQYV